MKIIIVLALCTAATVFADHPWLVKNMVRPVAVEDFEEPEHANAVGISGGKVVSISDYPFQLSMRSKGTHICGASIISSHWSLSAAHCTYPVPPVDLITFRGGSSYRIHGGKNFNAAEIINHPSFNPTTLDFDVCVIRITSIFYGPKIAPISLVPSGTDFAAGTRSVVSGWGKKTDGQLIPTVRLRSVDIPVVDQATCQTHWEIHNVTVSMVCAGEPGRGSCAGDAGGPLVTGGRQFGIVSWGTSHCGGPLAGVYTNIGNDEVRSFISNNTGV